MTLARALVLWCSLTVASGACTVSKVDPQAAVRVSGALLDVEGRPHAGTRVVLVKEADLGELVVGFALAAGTMGLVCLADDAPGVCAKARRTATAADGTYSFDLRGRDTQGSAGTASKFHLSASLPPAAGEEQGPSVTARFEVQTTNLAIPALRFWRPRFSIATDARSLKATWSALPSTYGGDAGYGLGFFGRDRRTVWSVADVSSPASVDLRVLEDSRGTVAVDASTSQRAAGTSVRVAHRSAQVAYRGPGPPPSRGRPCQALGNDGATTPLRDCGLTDGELSSSADLAGSGTVTTGAVIDLGVARPVDLAVLRGCPSECVLEASADGRSFAPLGTGKGAQITVGSTPGPPARFVRVRSSTGLDVSQVTELSIW